MSGIWFIILCSFSIATCYYKHSFLLYFSIGALISLMISLFLHNLLFESICFLSCSLILQLISTSLLSLKHSKHSKPPTSTKDLIGRQGIVTQRIGKTYLETGLVQLNHETWPAISHSGFPIPTGQLVEIKDIKGVHVMVSLKKHQKGD